MHAHPPHSPESSAKSPWPHQHVFLGANHLRHERRTWLVVALTAIMMAIEIVAGHWFGSMALVADGWHMSTHASALAITALAYRFAWRHAQDPRFSFGTGKFGELAAFASAIILAIVALLIAYESAGRLIAPVAIHYGEAMWVAVIGLIVNLVTAAILFDREHHGHSHGHAHAHNEEHVHHDTRDHNIRAAYVHVLADALTSVFAIVALAGGALYGIAWLDPLMGVVGALIIAQWSWSIARAAGAILVDVVPNPQLARTVRARLEASDARVVDLHVWRLGPGHNGVVVSLVAEHPQTPADYKARLSGIEGLSHVTVEVHRADGMRAAE